MSVLFEKTSIKNMELKNRLVRSATHEGMSDPDGFPTQPLFKLYERLAKGGVGLIITGYAFVSQDGRSPFIGMQGIDTDAHIPKYRELVDHVHEQGSKIAMQIVHCGRQTTTEAIGVQPLAPSKVKDNLYLVTPREMTEKDMEDIIKNGSADYISLCRSLIADAKYPEKIREGNDEPSRCIHCNLCGAYMYNRPLHCYHGKRINDKSR